MKERDKLCCVSLDEMEITAAMEYDTSSKQIMGAVTLGDSKDQANHALAIMLGGKRNNTLLTVLNINSWH